MTYFNDANQSLHRQALYQQIRHSIKEAGGVISFAQFMNLALYAPLLGYYQCHAFHPDRPGDFITAPELSPLFAYCFVNKLLAIFKKLNHYHIIEIGAGTGRFADNLLSALKEILKESAQKIKYSIYEISPRLRQLQQANLSTQHQECVEWLDSLPINATAVIIANEVLDALPTHCFYIDKEQNILERGVTYKNKQFCWQLKEPEQELLKEANSVLNEYEFSFPYASEINLSYEVFLTEINTAVKKGVIFFIDYGYGQREYYHPRRNNGTLTCFHRHQQYDDPFLKVGLMDITSHVNFTRVIELASKLNWELALYTHQSAFLLAEKLIELAEDYTKTLSQKEKIKINQAIKILTFPTEMGERVKVMILSKNIDIDEHMMAQDRRRDLI